ncbi:MAG: DUF6159 family protein [Actinomycetota bacterium]
MTDIDTCPKCGGHNAPGAQWCGQCFARLVAPPPPPPPPQTSIQQIIGHGVRSGPTRPSDAGGWACAVCQSVNPIGSDPCQVCQVPFETSQQMQASSTLSKGIGELAALPSRNLFARAARGFRLIGVSWQALKMDPELMAFPAVAGLLTLGVAFLFLSVFNHVGFDALDEPEMFHVPMWELWLFYAISYTIGVFCQAAVVAAATMRFEGRNPTLNDGLRVALSRWVQLMGWAVIAATVALLMRWLEEAASRNIGRTGRVGVRLLQLSWEVATYFAVPVILFEGAGATKAVSRSGSLFKRTWSETLAGTLGMGVALALIYLSEVFFIGLIVVYVGTPAIVLGMVVLVGTLVIAMTLSGIYNAALYRYATAGEAPVPFSLSDVHGRARPLAPPAPAPAH